MKQHTKAVLISIALLAGLPAAAENHAERVDSAMSAGSRGDQNGIEKAFRKEAKKGDKDELLASLEIASIYQHLGDFVASRDWFQKADVIAKGIEGQAVVSTTSGKGKTGGALASEIATQYKGAGFEKILGRTLNAINYTLLGDVEGALVEVRKAEEYHQLLRESHEKELAKAEAQGDEKQRKAAKTAVTDAYGAMHTAVADLRNSYENALTYFLGSVLYLADGADPDSLNHAWVDVQRAYELAPDSATICGLHRELARRQFVDDPERLQAALGDAAGETAPSTEGIEIVIVDQAGSAPRKNEVSIPIFVPTPSGGIAQTVSLPRYDDLGAPQAALTVSSGEQTVQTEPIVKIGRLAAKALSEQMPGIATRAVIRAGAKSAAQEAANKGGGVFGGLLAKIITNATEIPDLRGWYSVPSELAVARFRLPAGAHDIRMTGPGGEEKIVNTGELKSGDVFLINVRRTDGRLEAWGASVKRGA